VSRIITRDSPGARPEAVRGRGDGGPYGSTVLQHAGPGAEAVQRLEDDRIVDGEGDLREGFPREGNQPDPVVAPAAHEVGGGLLRNRQSVLGCEVLGEHGARDIHDEDDGDSLRIHIHNGRAGARGSDGNDRGGEGQGPQPAGETGQVPHCRRGEAADQLCTREDQCVRR
jgi:hypothetical protein